MAFYNNRRPQRTFRPNGQPQGQGSRPLAGGMVKPVVPTKIYTEADIHVDVVDLSFNDIRKVETGKYEDGVAMVEYLSEKQATDKGLLEQWQKAQPIDEYRQQEKD